MEGNNPTTNEPNNPEVSSNEELLAVQQELSELKELQFQALIKELYIDPTYLELVTSQIDKTKKISDIKVDLNNILQKYPKFKNVAPITGGVVTNKTVVKPTVTVNKNEKSTYNGINPRTLRIKMKAGK